MRAVCEGKADSGHWTDKRGGIAVADERLIPCFLSRRLLFSCRHQLRDVGAASNPKLILRRTSGGRTNGVPSIDTNATTSDLALVTAIRSGDQGAMAALYDRYSSIVYSVALRVLQDTGAAEDVLQDIFMQLWRRPEAFDASRGNMSAWLAVIARHRAIDSLRRRRPENDIEDVVVSVEPDMASEADRVRAMGKVRDALGAMAPPQRSALEMAYFEGLTHTEIAEKTGEPLGTIKTRIRTGLLSLRKALAA